MTYALSWPLQEGIFSLVCHEPACATALGGRIFDHAPPPGQVDGLDDVYMSFGDEEVQDWSSGSTRGAVHTVLISIFSPRRGFFAAKQAASAVSDAILGGGLTLSQGTVVNIRFVDARTRREETDSLRRIDMRFRITVQEI